VRDCGSVYLNGKFAAFGGVETKVAVKESEHGCLVKLLHCLGLFRAAVVVIRPFFACATEEDGGGVVLKIQDKQERTDLTI